MKVESFVEFYRAIEFIHKRRTSNDTDDAGQSNPLFDCDTNNEPEYKTILIPTPIVVVERLPEIVENDNNGISAAENNSEEDANPPERSSPVEKKSPKKPKTSRSKSLKSKQKTPIRNSTKIIRTIKEVV